MRTLAYPISKKTKSACYDKTFRFIKSQIGIIETKRCYELQKGPLAVFVIVM